MVSIIICSINKQHLTRISKNIEDTIGVPFELLVWDNRDANLGLSAVYNRMAARAKYPYLCFVHEDVIFKTESWGKILIHVFESDPQTSLVGVAGGKYKGRNFSGWYSGIKGDDFFHLSHQSGSKILTLSNQSEWKNEEEEVVCIDGVFMFIKQKVWEGVRFDELLLKGFHFYDIDFSLRVAKSTKVKVIKSIELVHLTEGGDYGDNWVKEAILFHEAHQSELPFYLDKMTIIDSEARVIRTWLKRLKTEKISFANKMSWIREQKLHSKFSLFGDIFQFLFYRPSGFYFAIRTLTHFKKMIHK
jgi:hypothetical protein